MSFDPQKFFIGLMDFFSILLPGALLTYLFMGEVGPAALGNRFSTLGGTEGWAAFRFASYLFGHLIFLLGSWLDLFDDWARRHTLDAQISTLARRGRLLPSAVRALIWMFFKHDRNLAVKRAQKIKNQTLGALQAENSINTFQWCKALLNVESPTSLALVQRFEADSKFFRCFAVVLLVLLVVWPFQHKWSLAGIPVVLFLLLLALWRYIEQRFKATHQAYWSAITVTAQSGKVSFEEPAPSSGGPTHAGGVVFRQRNGETQYLLVEATDDPDQWVLPKGHIEESEHPRETAVREVFEETGVWARIAAELGDVSYSVDGSAVTVRFYFMQAVGRGLRLDKDRQHVWLPLQQAIKRASHPETKDMLQKQASVGVPSLAPPA